MLVQVLRDWAWVQRSQWLSKEQLQEIQGRKLREIVNHAASKVPFYRRMYETAGVDLEIITDAGGVRELPVISKRQIRDTPLDERTAVGTDLNSCILRTTSGSTGMPITILEETRSACYRAALWLRRFWVYGVRPLDRACVLVPGDHRRAFIFNTKGLFGFAIRSKIRPLSLAADLHDHIRLISQWRPDVLVGTASYYRALIRTSEEAGQSLAVKVAIVNGEMLDGATRKLIADRMHTDRVFEAYGASEVGSIAWECPSNSGYHINAESLIVEFLRDGEPVAAGEPGEVCVTNLYRRATPMIRYLLGDVATPVDADCPCGRGLPLMKDKQGRVLDYIIRKNGGPIAPYRVMFMLEDIPGIAQFKVVQNSDYTIEVLVEPHREAKVESVLNALAERCRQLFDDMSVNIKTVDRIENPKGQKFRIVQSHVAR